MGLTNLPFCFNAFVEKPPFLDMVESNGVEGNSVHFVCIHCILTVQGLKCNFFQNFVVMGYFDKLL